MTPSMANPLMPDPPRVLENGTRVRTGKELDTPRGMLVTQKHLDARCPDVWGIINGIVPGHGGDVYWVAHPGQPVMAVYGWWEMMLLEPTECDTCKGPTGKGMGMSVELSKANQCWTACPSCKGLPDRVSVGTSTSA